MCTPPSALDDVNNHLIGCHDSQYCVQGSNPFRVWIETQYVVVCCPPWLDEVDLSDLPIG